MAHGAGAGTRVGLLFPNGPEFVVAWLAAARIGAVSVPLSTFSTSTELVGLLRGADVTFLLAAPRYRSQDYVASLAAGISDLDLSSPPPLWSEAVPSLRHIVFALDGSRSRCGRGRRVDDRRFPPRCGQQRGRGGRGPLRSRQPIPW